MELSEFGARIERALGPAAPDLPASLVESLEALDALLTRWRKAVDLVGFKSDDEYLRRYFVEALAALPWLPEQGRALDIGSGGGSPALPLALARRAVAWTLVEANERKALFLDEAIRTVGLDRAGATVVAERYENVTLESPVDVVTLRGVAVTNAVLAKVASDLRPGGRLLWFSSQERLSEARERVGQPRQAGQAGQVEQAWAVVDGPTLLVPGAGHLLVVEYREYGEPRG